MAFIPAPGIAQFNMIYATPGGNAENIFHVRHVDNSGWSGPQLVTMATVFSSWEGVSAQPHRTAAVALLHVHARDLTSEFAPIGDVSVNIIGTLPGAALPNNVTIAIKKATGHAGRGFRGRTYWVGLSEGKQSNDGYDATEVNNITGALNTLLGNVSAQPNCELVVLHASEGKVALNPRIGVPVVNFAAVDTTLDSQRRRLLGHNVHR